MREFDSVNEDSVENVLFTRLTLKFLETNNSRRFICVLLLNGEDDNDIVDNEDGDNAEDVEEDGRQ